MLMIALQRRSGTVTALHTGDVEAMDGTRFGSDLELATFIIDHPEATIRYHTDLVLIGESENEWEDEERDAKSCTYFLRCAAIEGVAVVDDG